MKWMTALTLMLLGSFFVAIPLSASDLPEDYQLRMDFLEERLDDNRKHSLYWQNGWTGFYAVSTAVQLGFWADSDNSDDDINYSMGALKSAGGLIEILLKPHPGRHGAEPMRSMPQETDEQRRQRLDRGETVLHQSAERAASRNTWKPHIKIIGVNLVVGGIIAAFGDDDDALTSTAVGIAIGEANIWSQPTRAESDWREYQQKFSRASGLEWQIVPFGAGLALAGRF